MDYDTIIGMIENRQSMLDRKAFCWWTKGTIHAYCLSRVITKEQKEAIENKYLESYKNENNK